MTPEAPSFDSESYPSSNAAPVFSNVGIGESFLGIIRDYNHGEEGERLEQSESFGQRIMES